MIAALTYAGLASLHSARPISTDTATLEQLSLMGFSSSDICGYGGSGSGEDCPNCIIAAHGLIAQSQHTPALCQICQSALYLSAEQPTLALSVTLQYLSRAPPIQSI